VCARPPLRARPQRYVLKGTPAKPVSALGSVMRRATTCVPVVLRSYAMTGFVAPRWAPRVPTHPSVRTVLFARASSAGPCSASRATRRSFASVLRDVNRMSVEGPWDSFAAQSSRALQIGNVMPRSAGYLSWDPARPNQTASWPLIVLMTIASRRRETHVATPRIALPVSPVSWSIAGVDCWRRVATTSSAPRTSRAARASAANHAEGLALKTVNVPKVTFVPTRSAVQVTEPSAAPLPRSSAALAFNVSLTCAAQRWSSLLIWQQQLKPQEASMLSSCSARRWNTP
jgi:hypothetical protein